MGRDAFAQSGAMTESPPPLPRIAFALGLAGLLPQGLAVIMSHDPAHRALGLAAGYFYAALIFSFLGGIWWGVAAANRATPRWIYLVAVMPSLIAFGTALAWMSGRYGYGPALGVLGSGILLSVGVDWKLADLGLIDASLLRLRLLLSAGLGGLTLLLGRI
jgi:hypothetical protein